MNEALVKWLGNLFANLITPVLDFIKAEEVGAGLAFIIIIFGIIVAIIAFIWWRLDSKKIHDAKEIFSDITNERKFSEKYNILDQDMKRIKVVGKAWSEFSESLVPPKPQSDGSLTPSYNTVRPHHFLNLHDMSMGPRFMTVWPNIFVGVGLFLTFLGLISALTEATETMRGAIGKTEEIQEAIRNLLHVAAAKFYASLSALAVSIFLTLILRTYSAHLGRYLRQLNESIERGVRYMSQESLAISSNEIIEEQLNQLKTFNTDLAIQIGKNITEAIQPVLQEVKNSNKKMTEEQVGALQTMGKQVSQTISGTSQEAMERVAARLEEVSQGLKQLGDILLNSLSGFDSQLKEAITQLSQSLLTVVSKVTADVENSMAQVGPQIQKSLSAITDTMDQLDEKARESATNGAVAIEKSVTDAAENASRSISSAGVELSRKFQASTSDLVSHIEKMTTQMQQLESGLIDLPDRLKLANSELEKSTESIKISSTQFTTASTGLRNIIEPLSQFATENRDILTKASQEIENTSNILSQMSERIQTSVEQLSKTVIERLVQLEGSEEALASYLSKIEDSTERVLQSLSHYTSEMDTGVRDAMGLLQNSIDELSEMVDDLSKVAGEKGAIQDERVEQ